MSHTADARRAAMRRITTLPADQSLWLWMADFSLDSGLICTRQSDDPNAAALWRAVSRLVDEQGFRPVATVGILSRLPDGSLALASRDPAAVTRAALERLTYDIPDLPDLVLVQLDGDQIVDIEQRPGTPRIEDNLWTDLL